MAHQSDSIFGSWKSNLSYNVAVGMLSLPGFIITVYSKAVELLLCTFFLDLFPNEVSMSSGLGFELIGSPGTSSGAYGTWPSAIRCDGIRLL